MAIYCDNELEIRGSKYQLEKCIETISGENGVLDFNKIKPIDHTNEQSERILSPTSSKEQYNMLDGFVEDTISSSRNDTLSKNQLKAWGVYGNAKAPRLSWILYRNKPSAQIKFLTNIRSPKKVIERLSEQFPLLNFVLHSIDYNFDLDETYRFVGGKLKRIVQMFTR